MNAFQESVKKMASYLHQQKQEKDAEPVVR